MEKKTVVALLLSGAVAGAGGSSVVSAIMSKAPAPVVHGVDLRRDFLNDGGISPVKVQDAFATLPFARPDGGHKDIGGTRNCSPKPATLKNAEQVLDALAKECTWE